MPARLSLTASASVPVEPDDAPNWTGMPSAFATSPMRSNMTGWTPEPRSMTGPPPSLISPTLRLGTLGWSDVWVTSMMSAASGSSPNADV